MKIGIRKPSFKARTTGKLKRKMKSAINPFYGKKGMGWVRNPKKALYNKVYHKTTVSAFAPLKGTKSRSTKSTSYSKLKNTRSNNITTQTDNVKSPVVMYVLAGFFFIGSLGSFENGAGPVLVGLGLTVLFGYFGWKRAKIKKQKDAEYNLKVESLESVKTIIIPSATKETKIPFSQLVDAANMYISGHSRIINDCSNLIQNTNNPKTFFERFNLLFQQLDEMILIEHIQIDFNEIPSVVKENFLNSKTKFTNNMMDRFWSKTVDNVNKLTTEKGKINKYESFFREVALYQGQMTNESWEYFQTIKNMYIDNKETLTKLIPIEDL